MKLDSSVALQAISLRITGASHSVSLEIAKQKKIIQLEKKLSQLALSKCRNLYLELD